MKRKIIGTCLLGLLLSNCGKGSKAAKIVEETFSPAPESKRCGPEGSFIAKLIPEKWIGVCTGSVRYANFSDPCFNHDTCYDTLGKPKEACDEAFFADLKNQCNDAYSDAGCGKSRELCTEIALRYFTEVKAQGVDAYDMAQKKAQTPSPAP